MSQRQDVPSSTNEPLGDRAEVRAQVLPRAPLRIGSCLAPVVLLSLALSLSASAKSPVPIEQEPRHRLEFGNQYVRVFDVQIPAGDSTLFHTHVNDGVGLKLSDAHIRDEILDGKAEDLQVTRGEVSFSYRPNPLTHRVSSIGRTLFRNLFVEILRTDGDPPRAPLEALPADRTLVVENERVRVSRQVIAPGQSLDMHQHTLSLGIAISPGTISIELVGEQPRTIKLEPGDSQWQQGGIKHSWKNIGAAAFEAVEIELKH
jgi:quercetin dioxygenase-like cupin family protein